MKFPRVSGEKEQTEGIDRFVWADVKKMAEAKREGKPVDSGEVYELRYRLMLALHLTGEGLDLIVGALGDSSPKSK